MPYGARIASGVNRKWGAWWQVAGATQCEVGVVCDHSMTMRTYAIVRFSDDFSVYRVLR